MAGLQHPLAVREVQVDQDYDGAREEEQRAVHGSFWIAQELAEDPREGQAVDHLGTNGLDALAQQHALVLWVVRRCEHGLGCLLILAVSISLIAR